MKLVCLFYLQIGQMKVGHQLVVNGGMLEDYLVKGNILVFSTNAFDFFSRSLFIHDINH